MDALLFRRRDLACDVHEAGVFAEVSLDRVTIFEVLALLECVAQLRRGRRRVLDLGRIGEHRPGIDAERQEMSVAVDDVAALCGRLDRAHLLAVGARHHLVVADNLQVHQSRFDADGPDGEYCGRHEQSRLHGRAPVRHTAACLVCCPSSTLSGSLTTFEPSGTKPRPALLVCHRSSC